MADNTQIYPKGYVYGINPNEENDVRLNDLADVAANAPEDGQVLTFNVRRNGWEAKTPTGGTPGPGGTTDYEDLDNKPSINGVELSGDKTARELGIRNYTKFYTSSSDPNNITFELGHAYSVKIGSYVYATFIYTLDLATDPNANTMYGVSDTGVRMALSVNSFDHKLSRVNASYQYLDGDTSSIVENWPANTVTPIITDLGKIVEVEPTSVNSKTVALDTPFTGTISAPYGYDPLGTYICDAYVSNNAGDRIICPSAYDCNYLLSLQDSVCINVALQDPDMYAVKLSYTLDNYDEPNQTVDYSINGFVVYSLSDVTNFTIDSASLTFVNFAGKAFTYQKSTLKEIDYTLANLTFNAGVGYIDVDFSQIFPDAQYLDSERVSAKLTFVDKTKLADIDLNIEVDVSTIPFTDTISTVRVYYKNHTANTITATAIFTMKYLEMKNVEVRIPF